MARQKIDRETKKVILEARKMIADVARADGNEAETRKRVERIFASLMGYDSLKHLSSEHAVRGPGVTEYCDFTIQLAEGDKTKQVIFVELKRVNVDLATKHLKQVSSYAINAGCEWIILTNGREWRTYHVSFGQPPETRLISSWNLLLDEPATLAEKFSLFGYRNVRRGGLDEIWRKDNVLTPGNLLSVILSEESIRLLRRKLKKASDVRVAPEEIVGAIRRILNEAALGEMENIKISLPEKKKRTRKPKPTPPAQETPPEVQNPGGT
ncbi:MAG: type I restriction enzyme HsdR N-terminal domain-containing protein [Phycisphaerae bacterium]|nr:type I restriction enzyme HsdR N-terminal domain-containing protein [Phycisphaerae bacterium]